MSGWERGALHQNARSAHPAYPERTKVPDETVLWDTPWASYSPVTFTHKAVVDNDCSVKQGGWADPMSVSAVAKEEWSQRVSHEGPIMFDAQGRPINPRGRTGMADRGLLGKWGPNHAADPVVTRWHPTDKGRLQMVAILRKDVGQWAIPGGMVDAGEHVSATVRREFTEEAGNIEDPADRVKFEEMCNQLFGAGVVVYKGYVDEPRNTDNAWIETAVFHMHCPAEIGTLLPLNAGDDAVGVRWFDIDTENPNLYPPHRGWVGKVAAELLTRGPG